MKKKHEYKDEVQGRTSSR
jgi:hypothetical protein